jgi:hypothetical protein
MDSDGRSAMSRMFLWTGLLMASLAAGPALADGAAPTEAGGAPAVEQRSASPAGEKPKSIGPLNERDLINQPVVNHQDRDVANVTTVASTPDQGTVAVLAVGGVLGFGRKEVAVPISSLEVDPRGRIMINASEADLKARPAFKPTGG